MNDETIWGLGMSIFAAAVGWSARRNVQQNDKRMDDQDGRLKRLEQNDADCQLGLANFKTEVANNYAKDATMQSSLARIHDRLDKLPGEIIHVLQNGNN
jgi:hypothetical protein